MIAPSTNSINKRIASVGRDQILFYTFLVLLISIIFSFRAVSSISVGLIILISLYRRVGNGSLLLYGNGLAFFLVTCALFFLLQFLSLFYTNNTPEGYKLIERSSGLIFTPLAVFVSGSILSAWQLRKILAWFVLILSVAAVYCLMVALGKCLYGSTINRFFYHDLVKPISQHAIQFSLMVFAALLWLIENPKEKFIFFPGAAPRFIIPFLSIFLLLLSSRLVISFYALYLVSFFLSHKRTNKRRLVILLAFLSVVLLLVATANPIRNRFKSVLEGNEMLFRQREFDKSTYFNGLQFRLLQWRFTNEILNEQKAWLPGLTPGDAQTFLDRKYIRTNMYTGVPGTDKKGFLGYHTHDQFLQSLLENGLPALCVFVMICYSLVLMTKETRSAALTWFVALLLFYCFTDAPFKTQYGIIIFTFFPSLLFITSLKLKQTPIPQESL